jgi:hypothetical protein
LTLFERRASIDPHRWRPAALDIKRRAAGCPHATTSSDQGVTMSTSRRTEASHTGPVHVVYEVIDGPDAAALQRAQSTAALDMLAWMTAKSPAPDDTQPVRLDEAA